MKASYLFSLLAGLRVDELLLEDVEELAPVLVVRLLLHEQEVRSPVVGVETPVAGTVLQIPVGVTHESLGCEKSMALCTLDTLGTTVRVQFGHAHSLALSETLVVHFDLDGDRFVYQLGRRRIAVQQGTTQPLGVRLGDESAGRRRGGQNPRHLQLLQLLGVTARTVNLQIVTHLVYLREAEISQHTVQYVRKTQSHFPADDEATDTFTFEHRLGSLAVRSVRSREDRRKLLDGQGWRCHEGIRGRVRDRLAFRQNRDLVRFFRTQHCTGTLETFHRTQLVGLEHFLEMRIVSLLSDERLHHLVDVRSPGER